jgi:hypothetical protein
MAAAAWHYLQGDQLDLFLVGFKKAHCATHLLWDLVDPRHPDHEAGRSERLGHPLRVLLVKRH